jgi:hypothetical protein
MEWSNGTEPRTATRAVAVLVAKFRGIMALALHGAQPEPCVSAGV